MIWFCIGTSGELIKIFSLIHYCQENSVQWRVASTGQSGIHFLKQWSDFGLPSEKLFFINESSQDLRTSLAALSWFASGMMKRKQTLIDIIQRKAGTRPDPEKDFWIVHGDTLSSVMGVEYGRRLGLRVPHVESGMTSGSIFEPFPEELSRRWTSRRAHYCFAPDETARAGLLKRGLHAEIICTNGNTLMDSVRIVTQTIEAKDLPGHPYALVNVHRYENLHTPWRWEKIKEILLSAADHTKLKIVLHPGTDEKVISDPTLRGELEKRGAELLQRRPFTQFIHLVANAKFLISDGGSNQQESSYLGIPCLILRDRTESREGMQTNCVLSHFKSETVSGFLASPDRYRFPVESGRGSPTRKVMETILHS